MAVTAQPAALMASDICSAFRVVSRVLSSIVVSISVSELVSRCAVLLGGQCRRRGRCFRLVRIETALIQLVAVLLCNLFQLDAALRGEGLARLHDVEYIERFIGLQN